MYNRLYTFSLFTLSKHSIITHALIHLLELIRKQLDDGNCGCGIFATIHLYNSFMWNSFK